MERKPNGSRREAERNSWGTHGPPGVRDPFDFPLILGWAWEAFCGFLGLQLGHPNRSKIGTKGSSEWNQRSGRIWESILIVLGLFCAPNLDPQKAPKRPQMHPEPPKVGPRCAQNRQTWARKWIRYAIPSWTPFGPQFLLIFGRFGTLLGMILCSILKALCFILGSALGRPGAQLGPPWHVATRAQRTKTVLRECAVVSTDGLL